MMNGSNTREQPVDEASATNREEEAKVSQEPEEEVHDAKVEVDGSDLFSEVESERPKRKETVDPYASWRSKMPLDASYLKEVESQFISEPTTYDEYTQMVNSILNPSNSDVSRLHALLRNTYNTSCVLTPVLVNTLQEQGINAPIQWAILNINDSRIAVIVDQCKYLWDHSVTVRNSVIEFFEKKDEIKSTSDFYRRCDDAIKYLATNYRNEDSPRMYLAFRAVQAMQMMDPTQDELDGAYDYISSQIDPEELDLGKTLAETIGETQGNAIKAKMDFDESVRQARDAVLGEQYAERYNSNREATRKKKAKIRREREEMDRELERQRQRYERDMDDYEDDDDEYNDREYERQRRRRNNNYLDNFIDSHRRPDYGTGHTYSRYQQNSFYRNRNSNDLSFMMSPMMKLILIGIACILFGIFFMGVLRGIMFGFFASIGVYGLLRMRGNDINTNSSADSIPPILVMAIGFGLAIFSIFLRVK